MRLGLWRISEWKRQKSCTPPQDVTPDISGGEEQVGEESEVLFGCYFDLEESHNFLALKFCQTPGKLKQKLRTYQ